MPHKARGNRPLDTSLGRGVRAPGRRGRSTRSLRRRGLPSSSAVRGLYPRAALAELSTFRPGACSRVPRAWDSASTTNRAPVAAHEHLAELDPGAAAASARERSPARRSALELAETGASRPGPTGCGRRRRGTRQSPSGLEARLKDVLERRIDERTRAMFDAGVADEVRTAKLSRAPWSTTARKTFGLDEVASLPRDEAIDAIAARTRQYAAYQRKWMRRAPLLVIRRGGSPDGVKIRPMTSSRWQAHGNVYLLAENEEYTMDPDPLSSLRARDRGRRRPHCDCQTGRFVRRRCRATERGSSNTNLGAERIARSASRCPDISAVEPSVFQITISTTSSPSVSSTWIIPSCPGPSCTPRPQRGGKRFRVRASATMSSAISPIGRSPSTITRPGTRRIHFRW